VVCYNFGVVLFLWWFIVNLLLVLILKVGMGFDFVIVMVVFVVGEVVFEVVVRVVLHLGELGLDGWVWLVCGVLLVVLVVVCGGVDCVVVLVVNLVEVELVFGV